ncbi:Nuclease sbcCD subunit C, putative [Pediculus humanus corporis]|uniref:Nuclease sbcCD subunit C, putative n=1 Tax=Pediculus humanus subsp. corporis TaxID=121224 RepID=E0VGH5_PEDHC|nr:Nuclease sbcCD subunit C, putative [Pediculus humanus corporis]EEB12481.1 Nuclease sbcCD subunit C, putative [Pediculus humanus corporis]
MVFYYQRTFTKTYVEVRLFSRGEYKLNKTFVSFDESIVRDYDESFSKREIKKITSSERKPNKKLENSEKIDIVKRHLDQPKKGKVSRSYSMPEYVPTKEDFEISKILNELAIETIEEVNIEDEVGDLDTEAAAKEFDSLFDNENDDNVDEKIIRTNVSHEVVNAPTTKAKQNVGASVGDKEVNAVEKILAENESRKSDLTDLKKSPSDNNNNNNNNKTVDRETIDDVQNNDDVERPKSIKEKISSFEVKTIPSLNSSNLLKSDGSIISAVDLVKEKINASNKSNVIKNVRKEPDSNKAKQTTKSINKPSADTSIPLDKSINEILNNTRRELEDDNNNDGDDDDDVDESVDDIFENIYSSLENVTQIQSDELYDVGTKSSVVVTNSNDVPDSIEKSEYLPETQDRFPVVNDDVKCQNENTSTNVEFNDEPILRVHQELADRLVNECFNDIRSLLPMITSIMTKNNGFVDNDKNETIKMPLENSRPMVNVPENKVSEKVNKKLNSNLNENFSGSKIQEIIEPDDECNDLDKTIEGSNEIMDSLTENADDTENKIPRKNDDDIKFELEKEFSNHKETEKDKSIVEPKLHKEEKVVLNSSNPELEMITETERKDEKEKQEEKNKETTDNLLEKRPEEKKDEMEDDEDTVKEKNDNNNDKTIMEEVIKNAHKIPAEIINLENVTAEPSSQDENCVKDDFSNLISPESSRDETTTGKMEKASDEIKNDLNSESKQSEKLNVEKNGDDNVESTKTTDKATVEEVCILKDSVVLEKEQDISLNSIPRSSDKKSVENMVENKNGDRKIVNSIVSKNDDENPNKNESLSSLSTSIKYETCEPERCEEPKAFWVSE